MLPEKQSIPRLCSSTGRRLVNLLVLQVLAHPSSLDSLQVPSHPVTDEVECSDHVQIKKDVHGNSI